MFNLAIKNKNKNQQSLEQKMNSVRAGVLGSNDGILTVVGVLFSTAAATTDNFIILIAGFADLLACAFSMAAGEYASVSAQRETERAVVGSEQKRINTDKNYSRRIIIAGYVKRGVSQITAEKIANELIAKHEIVSVVYEKYTLKIGEYVNPWDAAISSLFSAGLGGIFPLAAMFFLPAGAKFVGTILATTLAVAITGSLSAILGKSDLRAAVVRNVVIGLITVAIHYYVGKLF
ncbi:VIT family protein [Oenococcus kitaharae]|uniref:VIT1/CCC1 transporter family protein n=1 Tax=Oenococcus TaxID=46254 RepID=UPI0039944A66